MIDPKHSEDPWRVERDGKSVVDSNGELICMMGFEIDDGIDFEMCENHEANSLLIRSAPFMLLFVRYLEFFLDRETEIPKDAIAIWIKDIYARVEGK